MTLIIYNRIFLITYKKIKWLARLRDNLVRCAEMISPALENTRSDGTLVANTIKYFFTK